MLAKAGVSVNGQMDSSVKHVKNITKSSIWSLLERSYIHSSKSGCKYTSSFWTLTETLAKAVWPFAIFRFGWFDKLIRSDGHLKRNQRVNSNIKPGLSGHSGFFFMITFAAQRNLQIQKKTKLPNYWLKPETQFWIFGFNGVVVAH